MAKRIRDGLMSIVINMTPSSVRYHLIPIRKEYSDDLPPYREKFIGQTNVGPLILHRTSADATARNGDPGVGAYIVGKLTGWFEHNDISAEDSIEMMELESSSEHNPTRIYRIRKL